MAEVVKRGNHLKKEVNGKIKQDNFYFLSHVGILIASVIFCFIIGNILPFFVWVIYRVKINKAWKKTMKDLAIARAGLRGEKVTEDNLKTLPHEYKIISDVMIENEEKESQLDHIVVGPTGVFVVESKYWSGDIIQGSNEQRVIQVKNGRSLEHYHPSKQVGTHVYRLSSILKKHRKNTWVNGCVYFSNEDVGVFVEDGKYPLFDRIGGVLTYIQNNQNANLSQGEIKEIIDIIKKEIK